MAKLQTQIVRFFAFDVIDCEFVDADGHLHTLRDKVPVLTVEWLDESIDLPRPLLVDCVVLAQWQDEQGRQLVRISTAEPYWIESTEDLSEFVVEATQLQIGGDCA
ncbi:hypothetical protein [Anatilimnocola floriformis]|uniref:hypothetical protein n=1 Tax=Anatilimnocola floriformis TaxID=2948575 RepID=UPI0020C51484|nr:hypothetical protein [Anatilimnocola floriformis]